MNSSALATPARLNASSRMRALPPTKGSCASMHLRHRASPTIATGEYSDPNPGADPVTPGTFRWSGLVHLRHALILRSRASFRRCLMSSSATLHTLLVLRDTELHDMTVGAVNLAKSFERPSYLVSFETSARASPYFTRSRAARLGRRGRRERGRRCRCGCRGFGPDRPWQGWRSERWGRRRTPLSTVLNDASATQGHDHPARSVLAWASRPLPAPATSAYTSRTALLTKRRAVRSTNHLVTKRACWRGRGGDVLGVVDLPRAPELRVNLALAKQVSFLNIADQCGARQHSPQQPRSSGPISQCHRRVRVLVDLTADELSDLGGSIGA